jgi:ubiquinone/menaquinone biosynthesis C-methylase UbiE
VTVFDQQAERYDAWYDTSEGQALFAQELDALGSLLDGVPHPWLEVGVGSARFAAALGVEVGVDPARRALGFAAERGVKVVAARGEQLPFRDATFGAVLFVLTLCFVDDPLTALREARRVLDRSGRVLLGVVTAEGPWGRYYRAQAATGHPYYRNAHFFARSELATLLASAELQTVRTRSALFRPPTTEPLVEPAREGDILSAGFTALLAAPSVA